MKIPSETLGLLRFLSKLLLQFSHLFGVSSFFQIYVVGQNSVLPLEFCEFILLAALLLFKCFKFDLQFLSVSLLSPYPNIVHT
jgi:hypothetical protein